MFTEALQTAVESIFVMIMGLVIPVAFAYAAKKLNDFVTAKGLESNSEYIANTFSRIGDTIESVVNHTTQTFVQNLKTDNLFNGDMQIEAMRLSRQAAINMLDAESTALIKDLHGDLNAWIETQIESVIYEQGLVKFMTEQKS